MLNNDQRARLARKAERAWAPVAVQRHPDVDASQDWVAVVDRLWAEFDRMTTPRPRHDDDLAGLAARENASTTDEDEPVNRESMYSRYRTLLGTVSGLRAELAATLRRLDGVRESLRREQDAHAAVMRDLETAREAAEQYRRDATDSALRLRRIQQIMEG